MLSSVNRMVGAASTAGTYVSLGLVGYEVVKMAAPYVYEYFSRRPEPASQDDDFDCVFELKVKPKRKHRKKNRNQTTLVNNEEDDQEDPDKENTIDDFLGIKDIDAKYSQRLNEEDPIA